jgi:hypothetical protein
MNLRLRFMALSLASFFTVLLMLLMTTLASAGSVLSGTYKITENTDLGTQVRITVQLDLVNGGTTSLTVSKVGLRSLSAPGQRVSVASTVVVHSHSSAQVSLQFLMAKQDFDRWYAGPHQQFLVTLKPSGGKSTLVNVPLLRTKG